MHINIKASSIYGSATFLKFILEFFSASLLGGISDKLGRKPGYIYVI